ncbi:hypothetical protein K440DRAFT_610458 [Wilcoxina mikolae CBS 423.85]|nr:hypothetical protein K440DRAFT_610458 [Wilcoxina mikolae CBS 423.85]
MPRLTFFHLFYSTTFTLLSLVTLALVLIPPGDAIAQTLRKKNQIYNVIVIAGTYVLTAIVAVVLYTSRMYTFRQQLADIPKSRTYIGKGDLPSRVHAAVTKGISASAKIALISRPNAGKEWEAVWGVINHPGWAPPGGDLKGVEYRSIVLELPALLEREAGDVVMHGGLDPSVVVRQPHMTLRQWMENLVGMELAPREEAEVFVTLYERARFRTRGKGIEEGEFCGLMKALKGLLAGMGAAARSHGPGVEAWRYMQMGGSADGEYTDSVVHVESAADYRPFRGGGPDGSFGGYDTSPSMDYEYEGGYTPELVDSRGSSSVPVGIRRAASGTTMITPPRGRRPESSAGGSSVIRRGGGDGESIEMASISRRRRLSLRASAGTFG